MDDGVDYITVAPVLHKPPYFTTGKGFLMKEAKHDTNLSLNNGYHHLRSSAKLDLCGSNYPSEEINAMRAGVLLMLLMLQSSALSMRYRRTAYLNG